MLSVEVMDSIDPNESIYSVEKTAAASVSMLRSEDGAARTQASATSVSALSAATTSCGALVNGDMLAIRAGIACAALRGARKVGPPIDVHQQLPQPVQAMFFF